MDWGHVPWDDLYGVNGWCNVSVHEAPSRHCGCVMDGWDGPMCTLPTEQFCPNQCSGHGECDKGFCRCHAGWWGADCAERVRGVEPTRSIVDARPWLKPYVVDAWTRQLRATATATALLLRYCCATAALLLLLLRATATARYCCWWCAS
jgi:hypothetical protein